MGKPKSSVNWPFRIPSRIRSSAIYVLGKTRGRVRKIRDQVTQRWATKRDKKHAR